MSLPVLLSDFQISIRFEALFWKKYNTKPQRCYEHSLNFFLEGRAPKFLVLDSLGVKARQIPFVSCPLALLLCHHSDLFPCHNWMCAPCSLSDI